MPVLFSRREPNHISGVNFFCRAAFPLNPTAACGHDQGLPEGVGMPSGTRSRLEGDAGTCNKRRVGCLKERVDTDDASEPLCRTFD